MYNASASNSALLLLPKEKAINCALVILKINRLFWMLSTDCVVITKDSLFSKPTDFLKWECIAATVKYL